MSDSDVVITLETDVGATHFWSCHNVVTTSTITLWQRCHNSLCQLGNIFLSDETQRFSSKILPSFFFLCEETFWTDKLLNVVQAWVGFIIFREKITSWACLVGCELEDIFHLKAHSDIFWRSEVRLLAEALMSWIFEKTDVSKEFYVWSHTIRKVINVCWEKKGA